VSGAAKGGTPSGTSPDAEANALFPRRSGPLWSCALADGKLMWEDPVVQQTSKYSEFHAKKVPRNQPSEHGGRANLRISSDGTLAHIYVAFMMTFFYIFLLGTMSGRWEVEPESLPAPHAAHRQEATLDKIGSEILRRATSLSISAVVLRYHGPVSGQRQFNKVERLKKCGAFSVIRTVTSSRHHESFVGQVESRWIGDSAPRRKSGTS